MVFRAIEQKIEALFEGIFGRAFRTNVQPVELARKLAKEMDDHRTVSVSRVYVPNEYTIYLSTDDRAQFESYEESLKLELQEYLAEHARRESYALLTAPRVQLETDDDLELGEFGIATRMVQPKGAAAEAPTPEPGATMTLASVAIEEVLLILKIAFLVLLYLFIWRIVRTASRDLRLPQESFVLAPSSPAAQQLAAAAKAAGSGRLIVLKSPAYEE